MPPLPSVADSEDDTVNGVTITLSVNDLIAQLAAVNLENAELKDKEVEHIKQYVLLKTDKEEDKKAADTHAEALTAQIVTDGAVASAALAVKDIEIERLRAANANRRPAVDPRLRQLLNLTKVPGMDISMAGGDFNADKVKLTVAQKIAMNAGDRLRDQDRVSLSASAVSRRRARCSARTRLRLQRSCPPASSSL